MATIAYRIFEEKNGYPYSLFHGTGGSRKLPIDRWIESDTKLVRDGSGQKKKLYKSGFHVLLSLDDAKRLAKRFKITDNRVLCTVEIDNIWKKHHSPYNIFLAKKMLITKDAWDNRIPLGEL